MFCFFYAEFWKKHWSLWQGNYYAAARLLFPSTSTQPYVYIYIVLINTPSEFLVCWQPLCWHTNHDAVKSAHPMWLNGFLCFLYFNRNASNTTVKPMLLALSLEVMHVRHTVKTKEKMKRWPANPTFSLWETIDAITFYNINKHTAVQLPYCRAWRNSKIKNFVILIIFHVQVMPI